jgi:hypothetical protein
MAEYTVEQHLYELVRVLRDIKSIMLYNAGSDMKKIKQANRAWTNDSPVVIDKNGKPDR